MIDALNPNMKIRNAFSRASASYDEAAALQREVSGRLVERLTDIKKMQPSRVLDLGAGTGGGARALKKLFRRADVVALDFALPMLQQLQKNNGLWHKPLPVCADACSLPFRADSFDLIFSSLTLQWCFDLLAVWQELRRVMRPNSAFLFATLGPETLYELRSSWAKADQSIHVNPFVDMHDVGDMLMRAGFKDPVLDIEKIVLTYSSVRGVLADLKALGANAVVGAESGAGLMGKQRYAAMQGAYEDFKEEGRYPATFEIVYGLAWQGEARVPEAVAPISFVSPEKVFKQ